MNDEVGENGPDFNGYTTAAKNAAFRPSDMSSAGHDLTGFHTNGTLDGRLDSSQLKLMDTNQFDSGLGIDDLQMKTQNFRIPKMNHHAHSM